MIEPAASRSGEVARAVGLAIASAIALSFSRFAYALLLPPMREELALTYAQAGSLNAANGIGYVAGAVASAGIARKWGTVRSFQIGLLVSALVLLATALTSDLKLLFLIRTVGGFSTAFAFILGAALVSSISSSPARSGTLIGIYMAGAGIGIVVSGVAVPFALRQGIAGWREGWVLLGALGLLGIAPAWWAAGRAGTVARGAPTGHFGEMRPLAPTALGYGLFGAGYAGFMTFIIALLRQDGQGGIDPALVWIVLGMASAVCVLLWGGFLARLSGGVGPALVYALATLGTLPLLMWSGASAALATALVFGGSVIAGPASITIVAKQQVAASSLPFALSILTVMFSLGQALGPVLAGIVTDMTGSVAAGLWTSPILLALGAGLSLLQPAAPRLSAA